MLAVGPVAILPTPLLAALPAYNSSTNTGSFVVTSGTASLATNGVNGNGSAAITTTDRAVLVWGGGNFNIATGEVYNFQTPIGGAVLNKVGYSTSGADVATISGNLTSGGRVFILANGSIVVNGGANINTQGTFLSTISETSDFAFTTGGNLGFSGTSQGPITVGGGSTPVSVTSGSLGIWTGAATINNIVTLNGDLLVNTSSINGASVNLAGTGGPTVIGGNLSVITQNGSVSQSRPLTVAGTSSFNTGSGSIQLDNIGVSALSLATAGSGYTAAPTVTIVGGGGSGATATATINTTTGVVTALTITNTGSGYTGTPTVAFSTQTGATLPTAALGSKVQNDFSGNVTVNNSNSVILSDRNDLNFQTSSTGPLSATAAGNVATLGAVTANGAVSFVSTATGNVNFDNGSSVLNNNTFSASVAGLTNNITVSAVGNLTLGTLNAAGVALNAVGLGAGGTGYVTAPSVTLTGGGGTGATVTAIQSGGSVTGFNITSPGTGYTSAPTIVISGGGVNPISAGSLTAPIAASLNATNTSYGSVGAPLGGAGYDMNNLPTVTVSGGGGTGATVVPVWQNGVLISVTVTSFGTGYSSSPSLVLTGGTAPVVPVSFNGFNLTASGLVGSGSVLVAGTGYTSAPTVTFSTQAGASGASATAIVNTTTGVLTGITITSTGTGYTTTPTITLSGGGAQPVSPSSSTGFTLAGNGGNVSVTSTGNLTLAGSVQGGNVIVSAPSVNATGGSISSNGTVSYNATAGNLTLGTASARKFVAVATGNILQNLGGSLSVIANSTDTQVFNATTSGSITLNNSNSIYGLVQFTGRDISVNTSRNLTIGSTNATGNFTINTSSSTSGGGGVVLGNFQGTATQSITVQGNMSITTNNSTITDDTFSSPLVIGAVTLNTVSSGLGGASATINSAAANPNGQVTGRFGQLNANLGTGSLTYSENTQVNLGNITANGGTIRSVNSDIVINGNVTMTSGVTFNASTGSISENTGFLNLGSTATFNSSNSFGINLSNTTNVFGGTVTVINGLNDIIVSNSNLTVVAGNVTAPSAAGTNGGLFLTTVNQAGNNQIQFNAGNLTRAVVNSAGKVLITGGTYGNVSITANSTAADAITNTSNFTINNTFTLSTPGNVVIGSTSGTLATSVANITGNVVLANITGDVVVNSIRNLTISGNTAGNLTASAGVGNGVGQSFSNQWNLFLGNLSARSLQATAWNGGALVSSFPDAGNGISGNITQLANSVLHIENQLDASTFGGNIVLTNNGTSAGRVNLATGGATNISGNVGGNVTYTEDGGIKVGFIAANGTATLTSRTNNIFEDPAANVNLVSNGTLTLNTPNGSVQLGNTTHTGGITTGNFVNLTVNASGSASLLSVNNVVLNASNANSLTVVSGNTITQAGPLNIFGVSSFTAPNGITLTDSANNFGPIAVNVTAINKNVAITEANTLNLRTVTMPSGGNGTLTFTSLNGDIIDTGLGGVKLGGNVSGTGSGVVTLSAVNGNITIDDPTSDFLTTSGVVFSGKNVNFSILGAATTSLVLGAANTTSSATGNLVASSALGNIANAGAFTVSGNAFFQTTTGSISINQPGVNFGSLRFIGTQVNIVEGSDTVILTGSQALGAAAIISGGNITIDNSSGGVVTFGSTVGLQATGTITLKNFQALNTVTVTATGNKDLSALSLSGDLNNKTPVDLGPGSGPSTNPAFAPKP